MTLFNPSAGGGYGYNLAEADRIFTSAMTGLYGWTALGLGLAGAVAWAFAWSGLFLLFTGFLGMILGMVLAIGCLFGMQFAARRGAPMAAVGALYLGFTAFMGATLSSVFVVYSGASIAQAFAGAGALFAIMSVFGFTTKKDLSKIGTLSFIALIGMIVVGLLNAFLFQSGGLQLLLSVITLPIFMGLTAWETQAVKTEAQEAAAAENAAAASRIALIGAAGMFLNIVNMFLALLHIFGFFGGDD
jgi:FtsH-binding integral membrane protein